MNNDCQTLMSSFLLRFLIMILMAGVIIIESEFSVDADADAVAELRGC